jgi:hypothetical protein
MGNDSVAEPESHLLFWRGAGASARCLPQHFMKQFMFFLNILTANLNYKHLMEKMFRGLRA